MLEASDTRMGALTFFNFKETWSGRKSYPAAGRNEDLDELLAQVTLRKYLRENVPNNTDFCQIRGGRNNEVNSRRRTKGSFSEKFRTYEAAGEVQ